jgi:hypothetical protein
MADERELQFNLLKDHYENHGKSANYLLAAHGAGLLACLTTLKDYAQTPQFKGIGVLIVIFSVGLFGSVLTYASVAFARMMALNMAVYEDRNYGRAPTVLLVLNVAGLLLALACLVVALAFIVIRFACL